MATKKIELEMALRGEGASRVIEAAQDARPVGIKLRYVGADNPTIVLEKPR